MLLFAVAGAQALDVSRAVPQVPGEQMAMGRAGIAVAHGPKGLYLNPAAPAVRTLENRAQVSVKATASLSSVIQASGVDVGQLGLEDRWTGVDMLYGGALLVRNGAGSVVSSRSWRTTDDALSLGIRETHASGAWARASGRYAFGVGYRTLLVDGVAADGTATRYSGRGIEAGVMRFDDGLNLGALVRLPVRAAATTPVEGVPDMAVQPLEVGLGLAWRGSGPWTGLPTRFCFDLVLRAPVEGLSHEAALLGVSGTEPSSWGISPRLGMELAPIEDRLRVRGGAWVQAPKAGREPVLHVTTGIQVRVMDVHIGRSDRSLGLSTAVDISNGYDEISWVTLGFFDSGEVGVPWSP